MAFNGKWKEVRSENKEATLKAMGIPDQVIAAFANKKNTLEMTQDGDTFTSKTINEEGIVVMENTAKVGVKFTPKVPEGVPPVGEMCLTLEDGGKVLVNAPCAKDSKVPTSRTWLENGQLVSESSIGDAKSKVWYDKA